MKIVFFYPQFKKLTGAERLIVTLASYTARGLGSRGDVVILTHRFAPEVRAALDRRVRVEETGWRMRWTGNHYIDAAIEYAFGPLLALRLTKSLAGVVFFGPPSVPALWFTRRVLGRSRTPLLYFCFEPPRFIYSDTSDITRRLGLAGKFLRPLFALYKMFDRRMVHTAGRVLSNSPYGSRRIHGAYGVESTVIEHGVDLREPPFDQVKSVISKYGLEGKRVAVTVNHLHPRKRIDLFLRSFAHARLRVPGSAALVVGGGPERTQLESLAADLGLEAGRDVIFAGSVPETELAAHYRAGDVYVHTSREESFGLSVIEALALGLPVISVAEGGPCDTVQDGVSGYLLPEDSDALGERIADLLEQPGLARQLGEAGATFVREHYRWERGASTLLDVLAETRHGLRGA